MNDDLDEDKGGLSRDLTKKILTLGLGAYFLTEDTVRRYVKETKIPRDIGRVISENASKGKDELYSFIARELSGFLDKMDLQAEMDRFVKRHKIRINAEIEFLPSETALSEEEVLVGEESSEENSNVEWNFSFKPPPASASSEEESVPELE